MMCHAVGINHYKLSEANSYGVDTHRNYYNLSKSNTTDIAFWQIAVDEGLATRHRCMGGFNFYVTGKGKQALVDEIAKRHPKFKIH